ALPVSGLLVVPILTASSGGQFSTRIFGSNSSPFVTDHMHGAAPRNSPLIWMFAPPVSDRNVNAGRWMSPASPWARGTAGIRGFGLGLGTSGAGGGGLGRRRRSWRLLGGGSRGRHHFWRRRSRGRGRLARRTGGERQGCQDG